MKYEKETHLQFCNPIYENSAGFTNMPNTDLGNTEKYKNANEIKTALIFMKASESFYSI